MHRYIRAAGRSSKRCWRRSAPLVLMTCLHRCRSRCSCSGRLICWRGISEMEVDAHLRSLAKQNADTDDKRVFSGRGRV